MMKNYLFERLYLYKGNADSTKDIFVDKCPLIQHQLDGIRFLYRAFNKKKKHGVILNDPSGYGKRVQTALFLSAVLPTLDKPVLILCREGNEQRWKSCFQEFTSVSDDVAIELDNPLVRKKVVISLPYTAAVSARQEWSVIVIDDELTKTVLKTSWRAKLRVWITSSNIKEDLSKFSTFYTWVYPEEKFNSDKYKANKEDRRDALRKAAMLDAFLEDTVLRRNNGERTFSNNQVYRNNIEIRITKKNKDATGTKIKRSKRKSVENNNSTKDIPNKVVRTTKNTTENTVEPKTDDNDKPFRVAKDTEDFELGDMNLNTQDEFAPLRTNKTIQYRIQWASDTEDEEIEGRANKSQANTNEDKNNSQIEESGEFKSLHWDDTDSKNGFNDTKDSRLNVADKINSTSNEASKTDFKVNETVENSGSLVEAQLESLPNINTGNEMEKTIVVNDNIKYSEDLFSTDLTKNDIENIIIESKTPIENNKVSEDLFSMDLTTNPVGVKEIVYDDTQKNNTNEDLKIDNIQETKSTAVEHVENNKKTDRSENPNLSSFELKLKEMEELAMKKFKGSFLDSIF